MGYGQWGWVDSRHKIGRRWRVDGLSGCADIEGFRQGPVGLARSPLQSCRPARRYVLGFAVAVAAAVATGAAWKDWDVLWGVAVAAIMFAALLFLPFSRPLRQSLFSFRRRH
ncbi:hypothetical protein GCM10009712_20550 [Pseudarthrobacter sulfonivorans]